MLQVRNLTITHKKDLRDFVQDISFSLNPNDKAVIIGEEGNGKSTLLKVLYQEELVEDYIEYTGQILKNQDIIGYLPQELPDEEKEKTVCEFCMEVPQFLEVSPNELKQTAWELGVSIDFFYGEQKLRELSGGERVKLMLFRILLQKPDMYFLDEPSNDIDMETLMWLEQWIQSLKVPVLFISHDEMLIERTANMVIHLEQRERKTKPCVTIARVPYRTYVTERLAYIERSRQLAQNEHREYEKQMEKFRRIEQKVEHQQAIISRQNPSGGRLLKKKMKAVKSMERRYERESEERTKVIDAEEAMYIRFDGAQPLPAGKTVLKLEIPELSIQDRCLARDLTMHIRGNEKICIIGKNGVGKTTYIKEAARRLLERTDIHAAYMPQNYEDILDLEKTPVEWLSPSGKKEDECRVRTYLGSMKYTAAEMEHPIRELSGGQKAKILLLGMSLSGADVLILDEPSRNFSPLSGPVIREMLQQFAGAIISVSHDRKYIEEVCDVVYELTPTGFIKREKEELTRAIL